MTAQLTANEVAVLQELANGWGYKDIALKSGRSPNTVKAVIRTAQNKLQAKSKSHAIAEAFRQNLVK